MMPDPVLVVGGDSQIGAVLAAELGQAGWRVSVTTRRGDTAGPGRILLDLAGDDWGAVTGRRWSVAFLVAAVARLNDCTRDPERARLINVIATAELARRLSSNGTTVILLSTNQVFDGSVPHRTPESPRAPATRYGALKVEAEDRILALPDGIVLRLSKVISPTADPFAGWRDALLRGERLTPFRDMTLAPVWIGEVARVLMRIAGTPGDGVYQFSGPEDLSYGAFARALALRLKVSPELVQPVSWRDSGVLLQPPAAFSSLDTSRVERELGVAPWGVEKLMDQLVESWGL